MSDTPTNDELQPPSHGVVVHAPNGDVIRYDPSGLILRLSDKVIEDIALRLGHRPVSPGAAQPDQADAATEVDAEAALAGVDAWDIRQEGPWLRFSARMPGEQGVRGFRKPVSGGDILADSPGAVLGFLGLGGPRAALATLRPPAFPPHIVAPADDIGAVGHAGIETAQKTDRLEHLREVTHEALVAETMLYWQLEKYEPLPLFVTRVETDGSATAKDLAKGQAAENLLIAAENLRDAALTMGRKPRLLAVCLDYALEDTSPDATAFRDGMLALMDRLETGLWQLGYDKPLFVARFESGLPDVAPAAALDGQWELSWNHGDHKLIHSAPAYMFALDAFDRPTEDARVQMAEMTAAAIAAGPDWRCPTLFLAEREAGAPEVIRVIAQGAGELVIDPDDLLGAGDAAGFQLTGDTSDAQIMKVEIAPDDPQAVLVHCDRAPEGPDLRLAYACGAEAHGCRNTGALRDTWWLDSRTDTRLYRWALPAHLPIQRGRA
ncbi:hypothetical protein KUV65_07050 [Maritalea mobilis]|uniref:hypothetical protein n=1 Tax=Maritalea mobilis TaxID=483324 RepID=UPI001C9854B8|nr:hypothetical protein [Maritalea mobilis]MBY6201109.1 hypothetical protein [Maritalea mobilis]